jgi:predicted acetyltransferase
MEIRYARQDEKDQLKEMWNRCFGDEDPFLSWYFNTLYLPENTLTACENGSPVSSLQFLPYTLSLRCLPVPVTNIYGVFTIPEARNRGIMHQLIPKALQEMREQGSLFALLLPVTYEFYRKFGWETCWYHLEYRLTMDNIRPLAAEYGYMQQIHDNEYLDELSDIYKVFCSTRNGFILRTRKNWENILQDHVFDGGYLHILKHTQGHAEGYVLYTLANGTLTIREMGHTGRKAAGGLWNFIYSHADRAQTILWKAPFDDMTYHLLEDARETVQIKPFVMGRIVDVQKVLELLLASCSKELSLRIQVEDRQAPWNHGVFHVCSGKPVIREEKFLEDRDIKLSIHTLTGLSLGSTAPKQADALGKLDYRDPSVLQQLTSLFVPQSNFMNDYF